jgi:hypothetical protein
MNGEEHVKVLLPEIEARGKTNEIRDWEQGRIRYEENWGYETRNWGNTLKITIIILPLN